MASSVLLGMHRDRMRYELVIIALHGAVSRLEYRTLQAAREEMQQQPEAVFKCILYYREDEDMNPVVLARSA